MSLYNTTLSQPFLFAAFIYIGIIIGAVHSLFRMIRRCFGKKDWIVAIADVLFLITAGGIFFYAMYRITGLRMRGFHFIGALAGYAMYSAVIRPLAVFIKCKFRKKKIDNSRSR